MKMRTLPILLLLLSILVMPACSAGIRTPESVLEEQLREFHAHLRWGRFEEAADYVSDGHREVFLGMYEELGRDFEVTEYEIRSVNMNRADHTAVVQVWMQWFRLPSTRVDDAVYRETWSYDTEVRAWRLLERERRD